MTMNIHLVKAIVDVAAFLEYTNSELLDADTAVEAMEQLAAGLQVMAESDKQQLAKQIAHLSMSYAKPQSEFVEGLAGALGLS
jgi:hypothetical protein